MPFPMLENYLRKLPHAPESDARIWLDADGQAHGRYFNYALTSAFQPIRLLNSGKVIGFEAFAHSCSASDSDLSLWKLLDRAANDDESIELDRLCRMLHAINFYRQSAAVHLNLFLSVHERLLAAVNANHGLVFRRILEGLGLPLEKIVLQLPAVTDKQSWVLAHIADNYRSNGFRLAINTGSAMEALSLLRSIQPNVIKVDAREITDKAAVQELLAQCRVLGIAVVFKRLETAEVFETLRQLGGANQQVVYAQGYLWDRPGPLLVSAGQPVSLSEVRRYAVADLDPR